MADIQTGVDKLLEIVKQKKKISSIEVAQAFKVPVSVVREWAEFLEEENLVTIERHLTSEIITEKVFTKEELLRKNLLHKEMKGSGDRDLKPGQPLQDNASPIISLQSISIEDVKKNPDVKVLDQYSYEFKNITVDVLIMKKKGEFVLIYDLFVSSVTASTEFVLEKIRQEIVQKITLGFAEITDARRSKVIEEKFEEAIKLLINKYFPNADTQTKDFLYSYLVSKSLGLGNIDLLMSDPNLEEIVINQSQEPVWVYHRKNGWLRTNVLLSNEDQIRHYASMIGRKIGRQINVLEPLLDAHLHGGDRVNATLSPISSKGNTITIRKFAKDPWTITKMLKQKTISLDAASIMWLAIQYELSAIIAGGTASGKTSTLNCLANFFPPNQRIISIEDTRELQLPKFLHWVPLNTRLPNSEGKGAISMEDLLINSLRMRPDRILVGEVRRQKEVETLFEAIHTGHSCYATFHANSARETVERLTNPPINVPKLMLPAISLIMIQFRNRRTDIRRTFQLAEILPDSQPKILLQYDPKKDILNKVGKSSSLFGTISLFTGFTQQEINRDLAEKQRVLEYMIRQGIFDIDYVGKVMAEYYTEKDNLMKFVKTGRKF